MSLALPETTSAQRGRSSIVLQADSSPPSNCDLIRHYGFGLTTKYNAAETAFLAKQEYEGDKRIFFSTIATHLLQPLPQAYIDLVLQAQPSLIPEATVPFFSGYKAYASLEEAGCARSISLRDRNEYAVVGLYEINVPEAGSPDLSDITLIRFMNPETGLPIAESLLGYLTADGSLGTVRNYVETAPATDERSILGVMEKAFRVIPGKVDTYVWEGGVHLIGIGEVGDRQINSLAIDSKLRFQLDVDYLNND